MKTGLSPRRKGADGERELVRLLVEHGFPDARRTWHAAQSLFASQRAMDVSFAGLRAQVKRRGRLTTLYAWLADVDVCFLRADAKPWLALVDAERLLRAIADRQGGSLGAGAGERGAPARQPAAPPERTARFP